MKFNKGDLVRCIDGDNTNILTKGKIYTVDVGGTAFVSLVEDTSSVYGRGRFEKLEKVKDTELARKMFPNFIVREEGWLYLCE